MSLPVLSPRIRGIGKKRKFDEQHTPDSVGPILRPTLAVICLNGPPTSGRPLAMNGSPGVARPHRHRCDEIQPPTCAQRRQPTSRTLSPCSQLHARPAGYIAAPAGGLLPHRFSPHPWPEGTEAGIFSVAVVVMHPLPGARPHLLFHGATSRPWTAVHAPAGSREVPLTVALSQENDRQRQQLFVIFDC